MSFTANLKLNLLASQGADNVVRINEDLATLDVLVLPRVKNRINTAPPTAVAGDAFVVAEPAAGAWVGHDGDIAWWNGMEKTVLTRGTAKWYVQSGETEAAFHKNASSSAITTDAAISWEVNLLDIANSRVFEFDVGNPTRLRVLEDGDYELSVQVTFNATGTAAWNSMRVRFQTSTDGTTWSDLTDAAAFTSCRPTDVPDSTVTLSRVANLTGATPSTNSFIRACVNRVSGSSTVVATANTRLHVRKVR
jgi:hypothetical protein